MATKGRRRIEIEPKELIYLRDGGLTNEEIAAIYKCSIPTVANRTRELQLKGHIQFKRKKGRTVLNVPEEELREASKKMNIVQLAKEFGVSATTISKRLSEYGINTRSRGIAARIVNDVRALSTHKTRTEIADLLEVSRSAVDKCCSEYKIRCKGGHHTMTDKKVARRDAILALLGQCNWSKSEIGMAFDISRERVRQIAAYSQYRRTHDDDASE